MSDFDRYAAIKLADYDALPKEKRDVLKDYPYNTEDAALLSLTFLALSAKEASWSNHRRNFPGIEDYYNPKKIA